MILEIDYVFADIPATGFDCTLIGFALTEVDDQDSVWDWVNDELDDKYWWAEPDGDVMVGRVEFNEMNVDWYGVGIEPEGADFGNMAIVKIGEETDEFYTQKFNSTSVEEEEWSTTPAWINEPQKLWAAKGVFDGPDGNGEEWGQDLL